MESAIWHALVVNILLVFKLFWDTRAKRKGRVINHRRSVVIDGTIYAISVFLLFRFDWIIMLAVFFISVGYRWLMFDTLFSKINWNKWRFYGTSSRLDKLLSKVGKWDTLIKIIPIIIGLILIKIKKVKKWQI